MKSQIVPNRNEPFVSTDDISSLDKGRHFLSLGDSMSTGSFPKIEENIYDPSDFMDEIRKLCEKKSFSEESMPQVMAKHECCAVDDKATPKMLSCASNSNEVSDITPDAATTQTWIEKEKEEQIGDDSSVSIDEFDNVSEWFDKDSVVEESMPQINSKHELCAPFDDEGITRRLSDPFPTTTHNCVTSTNEMPDTTSNASVTPKWIVKEKEENSDLSSRQMIASDAATTVHLNNLATCMKKSQLSRMVLAKMKFSGMRSNQLTTKKGQTNFGTNCMNYLI